MFVAPLYTQPNAVNRATQGASGPLPPSVAPFLMVAAAVGSFVANLTWTQSNRKTSPGFKYNIYMQVDGGGFSLLDDTTSESYDYDAGSTAGLYDFYVQPVNTAGDGPSSNTVTEDLPGKL